MAQTAVMGAGSWGTAFAMVLADAGNDVRLWGRRPELCEAINTKHENPDYLPGIALPREITATHDPAEAMAGAEVVVLAVPSQQLRDNLEAWSEHVPADAVMVSLMKGVELGTHKRMSEVIAEITGAGPERIAVVSGPNLAREIANREPAASVVACTDQAVAERLQKLCHSAAFRPYSMTDVIGCELAGTAKNIIGLVVGVCVGLGYGDNTKASVITRGLAETARLGAAIGADPVTFMGLAGMSVDEVMAQTSQVAEGVKSCVSVSELAKLHDVEMPIVEHVAALIAGEMSPDELVSRLISRQAKP